MRMRVSSNPPPSPPPDVHLVTVPHRAASISAPRRTQKYLRTRGPCPPYPGLEAGDEEDAPGAAGGGGLSDDAIQVFYVVSFRRLRLPLPLPLPLPACFRGQVLTASTAHDYGRCPSPSYFREQHTYISSIELRANAAVCLRTTLCLRTSFVNSM